MPHETREIDARTDSQDADTAEKYLNIADIAAERALRLESRVKDLEQEVDHLKQANSRLLKENGDLREWAERLVHQVQSLGVEPVKIRRVEK
jgi:regulator of replication initiation timing